MEIEVVISGLPSSYYDLLTYIDYESDVIRGRRMKELYYILFWCYVVGTLPANAVQR